MIITETTKGLKESPMLGGIKGRYMMILLAICIVETLICVVGMAICFFSKNFPGGIISLFLGFFAIAVTLIFFRNISQEKDYKSIKIRPEIISNQNLQDYID
jgi:uncharacterized membrane protein